MSEATVLLPLVCLPWRFESAGIMIVHSWVIAAGRLLTIVKLLAYVAVDVSRTAGSYAQIFGHLCAHTGNITPGNQHLFN